jgi:TIR domain
LDDIAWKRLIRQIKDGMVVPVIGPQLMLGPDGCVSRQAELAMKLRQRYAQPLRERYRLAADAPLPDFALPRFRELNAVVGELKGAQVNLQDVYGDISELIQELSTGRELAVPEPIEQLAAIADFRLLVTLTPDDMLARCLRKRVAVNEIVHSPYLPSSDSGDLPTDWRDRQNEVQLLYLFGKACTAPMFAIHDEDVLEYAHNVIARGSHARERFIGELRSRNLLLLGSNFPDWLSRFFLRATSPLRLMSEKPKRDWLIQEDRPEESLTLFLSSFSRDTEVLADMSPRAFVNELYQRWKAEQPVVTLGQPPEPAEDAEQGALFFVSYCRQTDAPAAAALVEALRAPPFSVGAREIWFDRNVIEPGDRFQKSILDGIRSCRYFVPLISKASDQIPEKFFRREWYAAMKREEGIMGEAFVLPMIVDADYQPDAYERVPAVWGENLDFGHAPTGLPDPRTTQVLKKLIRGARSSLAA